MIVVVMASLAPLRVTVAQRLAEEVGWAHVHVSDEADARHERIAALRARMSASMAAGRPVVYSTPLLSLGEHTALRAVDRIDWVLLRTDSDALPRYPAVLTLDGEMRPDVLVATIRAVLRLPAGTRAR